MSSDLPWYSDSGDPGGPAADPRTVILLHAFPLSSVMWERLVPLLVDRVRVVCVDLPGLGRSGACAAVVDGEAPTVDAMARGVLAVLDELGIEQATYVGISTGGYAALALAARAPERVDGLVLGSTTPWVMAPDVPQERRSVAAAVERSASTQPVLDAADAGLGRTAHADQPGLRAMLREVISAADPAGVAWAARAIAARDDTSEVLRDLDRPVLLLFGAEDTSTPPERGTVLRDLRDLGPAGAATALEVLPATGHLTALEQPTLVADVLLAWLGSWS